MVAFPAVQLILNALLVDLPWPSSLAPEWAVLVGLGGVSWGRCGLAAQAGPEYASRFAIFGGNASDLGSEIEVKINKARFQRTNKL